MAAIVEYIEAERFTFFYGKDSIFSQWAETPFEVDDILFKTAQNYMMYRKAQVFAAPASILEELPDCDPQRAKDIGRAIPNFDPTIWAHARIAIVKTGNYAKFSQSKNAYQALMAAAGTTLVAASKLDRIWGIGLPASDPRAQSRKTWLGMNLLGEILTEICETFAAIEKLRREL